MNPSIKRLLGAVLLIGTLGVSSVMAVRAGAAVVDRAAYDTHTLSSLTTRDITHG